MILRHERNFRHLTIPTFVLLYKTMVRSHLDYCCSVSAPYKKGDIEALEKVQKRATKILPSPRHISYPDHLKVCKLTTGMPENRRTPQNTAGRYCKDRRTPQDTQMNNVDL